MKNNENNFEIKIVNNMPSFEETLARMKGLYTYGQELNESNNVKTHTLEYHQVGADGKNYGIIRECNKYYIKSAPKGQETIAEAYDYLGGFCNKGNYEYTSYANALKNFELKMASINEACDANINIATLDPFKKGEFLVEGTDAMKNEIARQRQIMYNVSMLMNEATEIGADRKGDTVMYDGKNPEAETGAKGDKAEGSKEGKAELDKDPKFNTNGVDKKVAPFDNDAPKCADQLKEEDGKCEKFGCDWGSEGMGKGEEPANIGWDIEGQQKVNEEENDWASKGLPGTPGVGEADTDHNNDPFNKNVNEGCCGEEEEDFVDDADVDDAEGEDIELGDDADAEGDNEFSVEDFDDAEGDDMADDTDFDDGVEDVDDIDAVDDTEDFGEDDDIMAQIEELQAKIDELKAKIDGGDEMDAESDDFDMEDDIDTESDIEPEDDEFETDDFDSELDAEPEDDEFEDDEEDFDTSAEDDFDGEDESFEDDMDECGDGSCAMPSDASMMESKQSKMNSIIESVVNRILNEDELHDFGKHPGYQKKPMELPTTGEDKNQWGRDWNDESVHGEEPFGTRIGDSAPFNQLVDAITKEVMSQLAGEAFKGDKKKEE